MSRVCSAEPHTDSVFTQRDYTHSRVTQHQTCYDVSNCVRPGHVCLTAENPEEQEVLTELQGAKNLYVCTDLCAHACTPQTPNLSTHPQPSQFQACARAEVALVCGVGNGAVTANPSPLLLHQLSIPRPVLNQTHRVRQEITKFWGAQGTLKKRGSRGSSQSDAFS